MQNQSVMRQLVLGNIKSRPKQYIFLLLGIVLAVMFLCSGVLTFSSMQATRNKIFQDNYGKQDVILFGLSSRDRDVLLSQGVLTEVKAVEIVADIVADISDVTHSSNVALARYDADWADELSLRMLEGRMPEAENEIALDARALILLRLESNVDDKITFTIRIPKGDGFLKEYQKQTYTLTGIYSCAMATYDSMEKSTALWRYPLGAVHSDFIMPEDGEPIVNLLGHFSDGVNKERFEQRYKELQLPMHQGAAPALYANTYNQQNSSTLNSKSFQGVIIVFAALMAAALIAIVNSLLSLLESRRRQIALLRAIGATRNQLRQLLLRETAVIAVLAVPLGVGLSVLVVWGICRLLGSSIIFAMNASLLLGLSAVCIIVILLTMLIPFIRIQTISPMQAIRDIDKLRSITRGTMRSKRKYHAPALLAGRNLSVQKFSMTAITILLAVALPLFAVGSWFVRIDLGAFYQKNIFSPDYSVTDYSLIGSQYQNLPRIYNRIESGRYMDDQDLYAMQNLPGIRRVFGYQSVLVNLMLDQATDYAVGGGWHFLNSYLSPEVPAYIKYNYSFFPDRQAEVDEQLAFEAESAYHCHQYYLKQLEYFQYDKTPLKIKIYAFDDAYIQSFAEYLHTGTINTGALNNGSEVLLVAPKGYAIEHPEPSDDNFGPGGWGDYYVYDENAHRTSPWFINDCFQLGDTLDIRYIQTTDPQNYEMEYDLPENYETVFAEPVIGGMLTLDVDFLSSELPFIEPMYVITTHDGLDAMGFGKFCGYEEICLSLEGEPDQAMLSYLSNRLERIASRVPRASIASGIERARASRQDAIASLSFTAALWVLISVFILILVRSALSGRIRAGTHQLGLLRAVGADSMQLYEIYFRQINRVFLIGTLLGTLICLPIGFLPDLMKNTELSMKATQFVWNLGMAFRVGMSTEISELLAVLGFAYIFMFILYACSLLLLRSRLKKVLDQPIIDNIRIL